MPGASHSLELRFEDVTYEIPAKKRVRWRGKVAQPIRILHNISGHVRPGESLAILGPSGSGKTTLLNLLAARSEYPPKSGTILFGGRPRVARTKRHLGYVMQDDVFFSKLTVRETLEFTANIRLPGQISKEEKMQRVDEVMERLRLTKCQNTRIGNQQFDKGISGGERKRVNIANELLHNPTLLLADECTSGLDSSSAYTVINLLRELCEEGRTVIATIHQPSSQMFSLFDKIMLLAAGKVAYFGPPRQVVPYFTSIGFPFPKTAYNPADYILELVIDDRPPQDDPEGKSIQARILEAWETEGLSRLEAQAESSEKHSEEQSPQRRSPERRSPTRANPHQGSTRRNAAVVEQETTDHIAIRVDGNGNGTGTSTELTDEDDGADKEKAVITDFPSTLSSPEEERQRQESCSTFNDPDPPASLFGRLTRAWTKRFWDVTGQHGKHGEPDKYQTSWFHQVAVLGRRAMRQKRGNLVERTYMAQAFFVTLMSMLFWFRMDAREGTIEDRLGALSFFSVFWAFYSCFSAVFTFPLEKQVLQKDRAGGSYRLSAYYFAKTSVETPADMIYPVIFSLVTYFTIGLNPRFDAWILFAITLILDVLTAQSIGLLISALVLDVRQAQVISSIWILSSMLISGYYIDPDNTPEFVKPLRYLSFIKYVYEALIRIDMLGGRTFPCAEAEEDNTIYSQGGVNCPIDLDSLLRAAQLSDTYGIAVNMAILVAWIVLARTLGYFALKLLHTSHKPKASSWKQS